jgi:hypothetical protein
MYVARPIVGEADHYAQFVKLCRLRIEQLGITYDTVDSLAGFPSRYTATLLSGGKAMSVFSFFTLARALALMPMFGHDEAQLADLQRREDWIAFRRNGAHYRPRMLNGTKHRAVILKIYPDFMRKRALLSAKARMEKLTPARRRKIARHAARARWGNNGAV